jgi:hypothetical protein
MSSNPVDQALPILASSLTCPECGFEEGLSMPANACMFFHECAGCGVLLRPKTGDCCVFCSYGSVACPPMQAGGGACCGPVGVTPRTSESST